MHRFGMGLLSVGIAVAVGGCVMRDVEKSFKTGGAGPRYIKEFKKTPARLPEDHTAQVGVSEEQLAEVEQSLNDAGEHAKTLPWFSKIQKERVLLVVTDLGNARFTVAIDGGAFTISRGLDKTKPITMVVPLETVNVKHLAEIFSDDTLTYEEQYRIYYILAAPAMRTLYRSDTLYTPGDKSLLKFDDLVQLEIPPTEEVRYRGMPVRIEVTAVNVDGQWLVLRGLHGDPDWRVTLTLEQATRMYTMGVYEVREAGSNPVKLLDVSSRFLKLLDETKTYMRADHKAQAATSGT